VKEIQGDWDTAFQLHSRATPTDRVPEPPPGPNEAGAPFSDVSQRVPLGLVTVVVVVAECPHADVISTSSSVNE
jgi:hypothetical protein